MGLNSTEVHIPSYLDAIEAELQHAVKRANDFEDSELYSMLSYHMGWDDKQGGKEVRGKRIRPLLVLLCCVAVGGDWKRALPAATAVELVHNFSLIHDDIEDGSALRRGRPTVWKKWGIPQAINCGDAMFALAHLEVIRLSQTVSVAVAMKAVELLQSTCLHLTQGQFLDLSYETRNDLTIDDYWTMVEGKTAALIATSTELGALSAECDEHTATLYREFGRSLGMAFQAQDDWLGIWGNANLTGKSTQSDLETGKKTLPILFGLSQNRDFANRWKQGPISSDEAPELMQLLETEGGKTFTESQANDHLNKALSTLDQAHPGVHAEKALRDLSSSLANRKA